MDEHTLKPQKLMVMLSDAQMERLQQIAFDKVGPNATLGDLFRALADMAIEGAA